MCLFFVALHKMADMIGLIGYRNGYSGHVRGTSLTNDELMLEVVKTRVTTLQKYDYFLMALTVASLGFAVQRTAGLPPSSPMIALIGAGLCWGTSLFCGLRRQTCLDDCFGHSLHFIDEKSDLTIAAMALASYDKTSLAAGRYAKGQFHTFLLGTGFFIVWHIWNMFEIGKGAFQP